MDSSHPIACIAHYGMDAAGWRPSQDDRDRYGRAIPDDKYQTRDFERVIALRARKQAIARHLTEFLKKTDRFAKTIVFCVDQEHASEMRKELGNLNADIRVQYPDYVCRVTADEGSPSVERDRTAPCAKFRCSAKRRTDRHGVPLRGQVAKERR